MIAILISAETEWHMVKAYYAIPPGETTPFGETFRQVVNNETIGFYQGGWGKIDAAASAQFVIDTCAPELIINLGTCGGFAGSIAVGDIVVAKRTRVYDIFERISDPEAALQAYTTELDVSWVQALPDPPFKRYLLLSTDRDIDPQDIGWLQTTYHGIAADWESGAIAHICKRNRVPCLILRGVSDLVSIETGEAYHNGAALFRERTARIMRPLLDALPQCINLYRAVTRQIPV